MTRPASPSLPCRPPRHFVFSRSPFPSISLCLPSVPVSARSGFFQLISRRVTISANIQQSLSGHLNLSFCGPTCLPLRYSCSAKSFKSIPVSPELPPDLFQFSPRFSPSSAFPTSIAPFSRVPFFTQFILAFYLPPLFILDFILSVNLL